MAVTAVMCVSCIVIIVQMLFNSVVLEFKRPRISQKLMSPGRLSPGFTYHRLPLSEAPASAAASLSTAGERSVYMFNNLCRDGVCRLSTAGELSVYMFNNLCRDGVC